MSKKVRHPKGFSYYFGKKARKKSRKTTLDTRVKKLEAQAKKTVQINAFSDVGADIFTTPSVVHLSNFEQGVRTHMLSFQLKGMLEVDVEDVDVNHLCRIVLVLDTNNEDISTAPTWQDVFTTNAIYTLKKWTQGTVDVQTRFKILWDKIFYVAKVSNGFNKTKVFVHCYKTLNKYVTKGADVYPSKNGLYLMFMSTGATGDIDFAYDARTRYAEDV